MPRSSLVARRHFASSLDPETLILRRVGAGDGVEVSLAQAVVNVGASELVEVMRARGHGEAELA